MSFYDVILHIDSGEEKMLRMVLRNAENYLNALPAEKFELVVVANGGAPSLFVTKDSGLRETAENLMGRGVKFKMCANAIAEHNLNPAELWTGCEIVPAGLVEIVRLQRAGFIYIKP